MFFYLAHVSHSLLPLLLLTVNFIVPFSFSKRVLKTKGEREKKRLFLSLSASLSLFSALTLSSHAHLWSLKLSLKMRVSSNELFSTLKNPSPFVFFFFFNFYFLLIYLFFIFFFIVGSLWVDCVCWVAYNTIQYEYNSNTIQCLWKQSSYSPSKSFSKCKLALVGIIPSQILFSFSSDKDRRTDSRIRRKNTAQPRRESNPGSCEF